MLEKSIIVIRHIQQLIQALVLPYVCIFCRKQTNRQQDLCQDCLENLPIVAQKCRRCARTLTLSDEQALCGACLQHPPPFTVAHSLYAYQEPLTTLVLDLKFRRQLAYARILGEIMAEKIQTEWYRDQPLPELLIPVPLHRERLQERGYNQALEIARPISRRLGIAIETQAVKRVKNTPAQMRLSAEERGKNLKNAFEIEKPLAGKKVAIIDDVMTTGSTMMAIGQILLEGGARQVDAWCCARVSNSYID